MHSRFAQKTVTEVTAWQVARGAARLELKLDHSAGSPRDEPPTFEKRTSIQRVVELWDTLFAAHGDETIPFALGQIPHDHEHSLIAFLFATQPTFGEALRLDSAFDLASVSTLEHRIRVWGYRL